MATSGSVDFSLNCRQIVTGSLALLGIGGIGETLEASYLNDGLRDLNVMIKNWRNAGYYIWLLQYATLFLEKNGRAYNIGNDHCTASFYSTTIATAASSGDSTIEVSSTTGFAANYYVGIELDDGTLQWTTQSGTVSGSIVTLSDSLTDDAAAGNVVYVYETKVYRPKGVRDAQFYQDGTERPIEIIGRDRYNEIPNKTSTGSVTHLYFDKQLSGDNCYIWPACDDVSNYINLTLKIPVEDCDNYANDVHFPDEWYAALEWNLAIRLAPKYGKETKLNPVFLSIARENLENARFGDATDAVVQFEPVFPE